MQLKNLIHLKFLTTGYLSSNQNRQMSSSKVSYERSISATNNRINGWKNPRLAYPIF